MSTPAKMSFERSADLKRRKFLKLLSDNAGVLVTAPGRGTRVTYAPALNDVQRNAIVNAAKALSDRSYGWIDMSGNVQCYLLHLLVEGGWLPEARPFDYSMVVGCAHWRGIVVRSI